MNFLLNRLLPLFIITVFCIGCIIRTIPVYLNYPYPIGYDSINYYLPLLYNFSENGINWSTSYPIYLFAVSSFSEIFMIDPYTSFNFFNIFLYGVLGVSLFLLFTKVMNISPTRSILFSLFVLVQLSTLRISWDLYRDLLSIIFFNFSLLLINGVYQNSKISYQSGLSYLLLFCLILVSVLTDRMVSILLIFASLICALLFRNKYLLLISSSFVILFISYLIAFDKISIFSMDSGIIQTLVDPVYDLNSYSIIEIIVLFVSLYGILIPFFVYGFLKPLLAFLPLKVPTIIALVCSFSWIIVPNYEYLVPERWVIISGLFISIFSAHGFSLLNTSIKSGFLRAITFATFFSFFIIYGIVFILSPQFGTISTIPGYFGNLTQFIMPISMSINSFDIDQNKDIVQLIDWINRNTQGNSIVIGSIHWRGWFSLFLDPEIDFKYEENTLQPLSFKNNSLFENSGLGLCNMTSSNSDSTSATILLVSSNDSILKDLSSFKIQEFGQFAVYNISKILCNY
ncbi:conserved membrane protein of unknown function [Candidatus Nitrosocosmicus franklandus]|uniref:Glycosyltransferase RgtA/B/C/D-like domain-containing protein n=1 Tax=Candidatus Nitrosocosmicus franklandianus TaxID=1798806 RepID=A0A484IB57_9ARCH|nr:conserved membrane protein of unknown function [Candidatus Nitrosocosmicus franklandus]